MTPSAQTIGIHNPSPRLRLITIAIDSEYNNATGAENRERGDKCTHGRNITPI